ncbi:Gfo/Idh/MocA family protein [Propionibacteriaceae bacterium Y2011]
MNSKGVGIVGMGARGLSSLGRVICEIGAESGLHIAAITDVHPQRLADGKEHLTELHRRNGVTPRFRTHTGVEELIADDSVDVVMITTPQFAHEEPFALAAAAGKDIYCDKPLAHDQSACDRMQAVWEQHQPRCLAGLTRRYEDVWRRSADLVADGVVGTPRMLLLRSVIPYHLYLGGGWWRRRELSGDILNEKASHHFDVLNWFADSEVVSVHATGGRGTFAPRPGYPEHCVDCDRVCAYRRPPRNESGEQFTGGMFRLAYDDDPHELLRRDLCVYSDNADILDHAVVSLAFANGVKAVLFLSVFGPNIDDQETLEVVGDTGRLRLTRHTGRISLDQLGGAHQEIDARSPEHGESHFGADRTLVRDLGRFSTGRPETVGFAAAHAASSVAFAAVRSLDSKDDLVS